MLLNVLNVDMIADLISAFPLVIGFGYFYSILKNYTNKKVIFLMGYITVSGLVDIIKRLPYPKEFLPYTYRPEGAKNCNLLSNNGEQSKTAPGFPSGQMATVSFYVYYIFLFKKKFSMVDFLILVSTGWARYYKKCHTIFQIISGTVFGWLMSLLWYRYLTI